MGYVVRQRDPQDERQVRIRLTPRGRSVREKGIGFRADYVETTDLMPAASRQLRQDMAKLRENLSKATQAIARRDPTSAPLSSCFLAGSAIHNSYPHAGWHVP